MRHSVLSLFLGLLISLSAFAAPSDSCTVLLDYLGRATERMYLDAPSESLDDDLKQLRELFIWTTPGEFNKIWQLVGKKDILDLADRVNSGQLAATDLQKTRLNALVKFVKQDNTDSLWPRDVDPWDSLSTHHPQYKGPSYSNRVGGFIAGVSTSAFTMLEPELLEAGLRSGGRVGRGNIFQRMIVAPYFVVQMIIKFNNQIRERLEYIEDIKKAIIREIEEESNLKLTPEEIQRIQASFAKLEEMRRIVIEDLIKAYGQIMHGGGVIANADIDIYKIAKRIKTHKLLQSALDGNFLNVSEQIVRDFNDLLQAGRKRQGLPPRTLKDMDPIILRVLHQQEKADFLLAKERWNELMNENTGLTITVYYQYITYNEVKDSKGNVIGRIPVPHNTSSSVDVTYNEVLVEKLSGYHVGSSFSNGIITSVTGDTAIVRESAKAAARVETFLRAFAREQDYQTFFANSGSFLLLAKSDPQLLKTRTAELAQVKTDLDQAIVKLEAYSRLSDQKIAAEWPGDDVEHFRRRNKETLVALESLRDTFALYQEQLNRGEFEMIIEPDVLDHGNKIRQLYYKMIGQYVTEGVGATSAGFIGFCSYSGMDTATCLSELWRFLSGFF